MLKTKSNAVNKYINIFCYLMAILCNTLPKIWRVKPSYFNNKINDELFVQLFGETAMQMGFS
jgi:hypothetical protein